MDSIKAGTAVDDSAVNGIARAVSIPLDFLAWSGRRLCRLAGLLAVIAVLAACASYEPKPLQPAQTAQQFAARRLDVPELREQIARILPQATTNWPPAEWDRATLLAVALVSNPKLDIARAEVRAALAHEVAAAQPANPDLNLQSEYARHDPHPWLYGFALDLLIRSPGQKHLQTELAGLGTSNARWQLLEQVWTTRRGLVAALSDGVAVQRRLHLLDLLASAQDRLVAIEEKRVVAGEDAPGELLPARQARIEIAQQRAQAQASAHAAQAALAAALGLPPEALDGVVIHWPEWGEPPRLDDNQLGQSREQALLSRADLAAAIGDYAESENKLQQTVMRQYPQLHLSPGYYWDHGIAKFPFDVGFTLPLFSRGEIAEARAAREVSARRMLALQAGIYGDIAAAERAEQGARASLATAERGLQSSRQQEQQAQLGLRLGALGAEESIAAQILTIRGELETLQAREELQAARNALEDALHAPLSGPELELSHNLSVAAAEADR